MTTSADTFRVERSIYIDAVPAEIAPLIEDFHRWTAWSPYEKLDPAMQRGYAGADHGVGAVYTWTGKKAGAGRMEVKDVRPERITIQLDFTRPMKASNTALFEFAPDGEGTRVTWAMEGRETLMTKLMHRLINMDRMLGKDFERGLADLKAQAERAPAQA